MTQAIGDYDSDAWNYANYASLDVSDPKRVTNNLDELEFLIGMHPEEVLEKFTALIREDRYEEILAVFDTCYLAAQRVLDSLRAEEIPSNELQDVLEFAEELIDDIALFAKSNLLLLSGQPQEAIACCNLLIAKMKLTNNENFKLPIDAFVCRGFSYLMIGDTKQGIEDLRKMNDLDFEDEDLELTLAMRIIEKEISAKILIGAPFIKENMQYLSFEEQVEFYLMNGAPELALELLEQENVHELADSDLFCLEYKVLAQTLAGRVDEAAINMDALVSYLIDMQVKDCLSDEDLDTSLEFLYFVRGDYVTAKEEAKKSMNLSLLTVIQCLETLQRRAAAPSELAMNLNKA